MTYAQHGTWGRPTAAAAAFTPQRGREHPIDAIEEAAAMLGRRWKLAIVFLLARGRYRYNAMMRELPGVTPKMLTQQLRALEGAGLVARFEYAGGAKHTEYALTPVGETFVPVVHALTEWVSVHWQGHHDRDYSAPPVDRDVTPNVRPAHATTVAARAD
jgi:DNA-binding HxlR family transcriptional regulator